MRLGKYLAASLSAIVVVALPAGCGTSPPGEGITNGPAPVYSAEKPAERTDDPLPDVPAKDVLAGEKAAAAPGTDAAAPSAGDKDDAKGKNADAEKPAPSAKP